MRILPSVCNVALFMGWRGGAGGGDRGWPDPDRLAGGIGPPGRGPGRTDRVLCSAGGHTVERMERAGLIRRQPHRPREARRPPGTGLPRARPAPPHPRPRPVRRPARRKQLHPFTREGLARLAGTPPTGGAGSTTWAPAGPDADPCGDAPSRPGPRRLRPDPRVRGPIRPPPSGAEPTRRIPPDPAILPSLSNQARPRSPNSPEFDPHAPRRHAAHRPRPTGATNTPRQPGCTPPPPPTSTRRVRSAQYFHAYP